MIIKNILIGSLLVFAGFLIAFAVVTFFETRRMLDNRRKKRIIDMKRYKEGLKPEMRDSIIKTR